MKKDGPGLIIETIIKQLVRCLAHQERCQTPKMEGECFGEKV